MAAYARALVCIEVQPKLHSCHEDKEKQKPQQQAQKERKTRRKRRENRNLLTPSPAYVLGHEACSAHTHEAWLAPAQHGGVLCPSLLAVCDCLSC